MNISYNWLKKYIAADLSAEAMATILTDIGLEVESFEKIETVRGGMNIFLGGEGLFLTRLVGPGRVILQTQNFAEFCGRIRPYMPTGGNN